MSFVFELSKVLFYMVSVFLIILKVQGDVLFDEAYANKLIQYLIPGFLVLGGVVVGWILAVFFGDSYHPSSGVLLKGFIVGVLLGASLAILYSWILIAGFRG